jgi:hydantoinase/carbamoylase family amidase
MIELGDQLGELAAIGADGDGVTRLAWSAELEDALDWCAGRMRDAGLAVERDPAGNLIGRWESGSGTAVVAGSHLDTVPAGGRFDGALGVLAALDAVRRLRAEGFEPARPIWVVAFMDEEGARFGTPMFGSRAFAGDAPSELGQLADRDGTALAEAMRSRGLDLAGLPRAARVDRVGAYLELHIEQGPVLEDRGLELGVVTGIDGILGLRVTFTGSAGHAGTTPMSARRDALVGAARLVGELRGAARAKGTFRATVGTIACEPGAHNVIPARARMAVDLRASDGAALDDADALVRRLVDEIATVEGLDAEIAQAFRNEPVLMAPELVAVLEQAAADAGARFVRMTSGAAHDAMVIARHAPAAMLFVPSRAGVSHAPEEFTELRLCELGAQVLARALERLTKANAPLPAMEGVS